MNPSILTEWKIDLDVDAVLRGQGADPAIIRQRKPVLVEIAAQALDEGTPLLHPHVAHREFGVDGLRHERLALEGGGWLTGPLIARHLGPAQRVIVMVCTIGPELEETIGRAMRSDVARGLALDGLGSAAVEMLANQVCHRFEEQAHAVGLETTIPLSPGMIGWAVDEGQPQIFSLLDTSEIGVTLADSGMMLPRKSLSMALGIGADMGQAGRTCDYCAVRETCRYQSHYEALHGPR